MSKLKILLTFYPYGYAYGLGLIHFLFSDLYGFVLELIIIFSHGVTHLFHSSYDLIGTHLPPFIIFQQVVLDTQLLIIKHIKRIYNILILYLL